jgi:hypothetical protein
MTRDRATKILKNTKEVTIVNQGGSRNKLNQNVDKIGDIWISDSKLDNSPNKVTIARRIRELITI